MPPPELTIDDEDYASEEDSDFAPDDAPEREGDGGGDSSDDDAASGNRAAAPKAAASSPNKRRHDGDDDAAEDAGFENSGDEAIIEKGKKRRKKGRQTQQDREDEGGEGGLIKTRSMRAVEKSERKTKVASGPVTVDVDALWASMTAATALPTRQEPRSTDPHDGSAGDSTTAGAPGTGHQDGHASGRDKGGPSEMIKIRRTYNFAGKVHTEEKLVTRDSAEARLHFASRGDAGDKGGGEDNHDTPPPDDEATRVPRRAYRSAFEPTVAGDGPRADLNLGIAGRLRARDEKARRLNTVEKSRMDWAGFVDKEGIKDELALAGRAKGAFADRQDFLARTEARREEDARRVRLAGKT